MSELWQAVRLLEVPRRRAVLAVLTGSAGLASAVGLAAVSAWLIARASQMPPVMYLTVATVAVRALGVSRGVLRYLERLASHDVALRGMARLRERLYARLAEARPDAVLALRRGDVLARVGADVDAVGDVVVRGLLPIAVAAVVSAAGAVLVGAFLPAAGLALAACLALAGGLGPWLAVRAARAAEVRSVAARADVSASVVTVLDGAAELTVTGGLGRETAALADAEARLARATDAAARPAAWAAAVQPLATGLAVLAALALGIPATTAGALAPVELAVVVLTPLAAFEAAGMVPMAAVSLVRSREAARRVLALMAAPAAQPPAPAPAAPAAADGTLVAAGLACGWPGRPPALTGIDLEVGPGRSVAVVGPSGVGKTTLLATLAGLLPPVAGTVRVDGLDPAALDRADAARHVAFLAEDAHVFDTTVLENLRVARGDVTPDEATAVLRAVGLGPWLAGLPDGLDTLLGADAARVSGGERRRLLLARALLAPARVLLLDEPTEHVDAGAAELLAALLDGSLAGGRAVVVVTHRLAGLAAAGEVILLDGTGSVRARGTHEELRAAGLLPAEESG
ncbi:MAG: thiol reductant ABC exporter subunit CydC [Actinomycetales bacterium]|nr:thiol reductant ABC exporter subunit CydC [Actinomycetales bacterium]